MAKNILKEAIADAKAVREVALANAKAALEEAFTPKLQNMLSAKLSEDLDEDFYEEDEKEIELGEMGNHNEAEEPLLGDESSIDDEIDLEEILNELEAEEGDEADDEEDLEEIHRVGQPNYKANDVHDVLNRASDINDGLDESKNFDLNSLLKEINDLEDEEEILEIEDDETVDEIENQVTKKWRKKLRGARNESAGGCGCNEEKRIANNLKAKLNESQKAFNTVRNELKEVNLLNSKLLYVNRIFKANTLNETQKLRVVETLDKATSIKESKLIYETIKNTFTLSSTKKKKTISKKPIRENFGMASKAAGMSRTKRTAPKTAILNESNNMVARMQKLANISKIKE